MSFDDKQKTLGSLKVSSLKEKEMLLLSRFYDQECSFLEKGKVRRLLLNNNDAASYLRSLEGIGKELSDSSSFTVDLWAGIDRRLDQEEHAALFLGDRKPLSREDAQPRSILNGVSWGAAGALVAACLVLVVVGTGDNPSNPIAGSSLASNGSGTQGSEAAPAIVDLDTSFVANVQHGGTNASVLPNSRRGADSQFDMNSNGFEVNWMRSDGRVSVIQGRDGKSAVIWVRRRDTRLPKRLPQPGTIIGSSDTELAP